MLVKVAELIGPALDWAVAKCEGKVEAGVYGVPEVVEGELHLHYCDTVLSDRFAPTKCWAQGGPLIASAGIAVSFGPQWTTVHNRRLGHYYYGPTPLIAICRCYVASKLGDTVDIPDELFKGNKC